MSITYETYSRNNIVLHQFDVVYVNMNTDSEVKSNENLSIQKGVRPAVVIQNDTGNYFSSTVLIIPLTSKIKKLSLPTHEMIESNRMNGLKYDSMLLGEQMTVVSKERITSVIGCLNSQVDKDKVLSVYLNNIIGKNNEQGKTMIGLIVRNLKRMVFQCEKKAS